MSWDEQKGLIRAKIQEFENNIGNLFEKINGLDKDTTKDLARIESKINKDIAVVKEYLLKEANAVKEESFKSDSELEKSLQKDINSNTKDIAVIRKELAFKTSLYAASITGLVNGIFKLIEKFA